MLSVDALNELYRDHRSDSVLSVYLDASQTDPALKSAWFTRFDREVRSVRRDLERHGEDVVAFNRAVERMSAALGDPDTFLHGRGWVGFTTSQELLYHEGVPVPMPNLVRWEPGIRVAPYLRALKQSRPIGAAIVDSRRARLFRFHDGRLEEVLDLHGEPDTGDSRDSLTSKRAETSSGVRGATGKDKAKSAKDTAARRMLDGVAERLMELVGPEGPIVLGGVDSVVNQLRKILPPQAAEYTAVRHRLSFDLGDADIRAEIESAASELSRSRQSDLVENVFDLALSGGAACLGIEDTKRALKNQRVRTLVVSATLRRSEPDEVDWLLGRAFEGGAAAIEVSPESAERLDQEAQGVAALMHYRVGAAKADPV